MRRIRRAAGAGAALAVVAALAVGGAPAAWSHGYVGGEGSGMVARAALRDNVGLGAVQWEPQSIEGPKGFPESGPADGQLASGGNARFSELDAQSSDRWVKNSIAPGRNTISWTYTAPHRTTRWDYFMTRPGWNPDTPLARADLEKIATVEHDGTSPARGEAHVVDVPEDRVGYHVIYAVWVVDDTANAFYNVIDVDVQGDPVDPVEPGEPPVLTGDPTVAGVGGDHVALAWPAATSEVGVAGYEVHRDGVEIARTGAPGYTDRSVRPGSTYTYTVRAFDRAGAVSAHSAAVRVSTPDAPVALTVGGLHTMGVEPTAADLMWSPAQGGVGGVAYTVRRAEGSSGFVDVGETSGTRFVDTGLRPGVTYSYVVTARDAAGSTASTAVLQVRTPGDVDGATAWDAFGRYAVGDRVTHGGREYVCIQAYTGHGDPNWILAPSLWRLAG